MAIQRYTFGVVKPDRDSESGEFVRYEDHRKYCQQVAELLGEAVGYIESSLAAAKEAAEKTTMLRKILSHVPGRVALKAKEDAGYGDNIHAQWADAKVSEAWVEFSTVEAREFVRKARGG